MLYITVRLPVSFSLCGCSCYCPFCHSFPLCGCSYVASLSGGFCGSKAFESCCEGFGACKGCPKCATWQFRSPIETACGASGGTMAKQAGRLRKLLRRVLTVQRPWKGAAGVLRLLRGAQNVPRSSFEAQYKQLVEPRDVPWQSKRDAFASCCGVF